MRKLAVVLFALSLVVGGSAIYADAGTYVSGNIGAVFVDDADLSFEGVPLDAELSFDTGYGATLAIGHAYANGARAEVEVAYRANDLDKISVSGLGSGSIDGEMTSWGVLLNMFFDFDTGTAFKPFIGAGVGYANVDLEIEGESEDDNVFAYQLMAGCGYAVSPVVTLDVQYRYFASDDPEFSDAGMTVDSEYMTHNIMFGLRYNF